MFMNSDFNQISMLDLDPIKIKLMHVESGEGWSLEYASAVEREYRRFLYLMKTYPDEPTAPLTDVDTFWHYHILDTMKYAADCEQVFGFFLHHFPYVGMRGQEDKEALDRMGERMRTLYEETFEESYAPAACKAATADAAFCAAISAKPAFCAATSAEPAFCAVTAAKPAFCAVTSAEPAFCAVTAAKPAFCAVTNAEPAFCAVTAAKPAFCAVTSAEPAFCAVTAAKPAFCAVTSAEPAFCAVTAAKPAFCAVTNAEPAFCAVTAAKPAFCAVTTSTGAKANPPDFFNSRPTLALA
jgi:hypothetical protein